MVILYRTTSLFPSLQRKLWRHYKTSILTYVNTFDSTCTMAPPQCMSHAPLKLWCTLVFAQRICGDHDRVSQFTIASQIISSIFSQTFLGLLPVHDYLQTRASVYRHPSTSPWRQVLLITCILVLTFGSRIRLN